DLATCKVSDFKRTLDMKRGLLHRSFIATLPDGKKVQVDAQRFCSMADGEVGAIRYAITPINFSASAAITLSVDADVVNKDSNYDEKFWNEVSKEVKAGLALVIAETKKTFFHVATAITYSIQVAGKVVKGKVKITKREKYA
ncbi:MAG: glycoside hydrolase family 65 protein, partial [Flammeovirgaceae bacterium]